MSKANILMSALMFAVSKLGGAHLTRQARERTARTFVRIMSELGFTHLLSVADIRGKHLRHFVARRSAAGVKVRTIHNEMAHIRCIFRVGGRSDVANAKELTNQALGLTGASRKGTKAPLSDADYQRARLLALNSGRPGMAAMIRLQRVFGLRANEAIHARSDTLDRWRSELYKGKISVIAGTKGGRPRNVPILSIDEALAAIDEAREIALRQGSFLIVRANGKPSGGLKQARSICHGWCNRVGIEPHSARYAFAQELLTHLIANRHSEREALIVVSLALGHGDGRGRYVRQVYGRAPIDLVDKGK